MRRRRKQKENEEYGGVGIRLSAWPSKPPEPPPPPPEPPRGPKYNFDGVHPMSEAVW